MNYFFLISNKKFKCKLIIPKFQNRGKYASSLFLYSARVLNKKWKIEKPKFDHDDNFYYINNCNNNLIFFLSKKYIRNIFYNTLNFENDFLLTRPAYRCNLRIFNKFGGFSSYQSEYPSQMTKKEGTILSQISTLLNPEANQNFLIFPNIYYKPIHRKFCVYILDMHKKKIVKKNFFETNKVNFWKIKNDLINDNYFFFSDGFLGVPIYLSEKKYHLSLEHTHPLQSYILTDNKYVITQKLKNEAKKIISRYS